MHGGSFRSGNKRREAQAMKWHLAAAGWVVISANYRLNPEGRYPDAVVDMKRVISWARRDGQEWGIDPRRVFIGGGSAGAHIAAVAGLTSGLKELQPGFERDDTSVSGVIGLYGYFGGLEYPGSNPRPGIPSSPRAFTGPGAPPFLLVHGSDDTLVPPAGAFALSRDLKASGNQVSLAILPGAQHTFDLLRSVRSENVTAAIIEFAGWVETRHRDGDSPIT